MFRALAFGKGFGGTSVALGALGVGAASLLLVNPDSVPGAMVGVFALIVFHFALGWKVYRLSRSTGTNDRSYSYLEKEHEKGDAAITAEHNKT